VKRVDKVFEACYRKKIFGQIGFFNKDLVKRQDMEFNLRLKKAGGKTLLVPDITGYYYARSDLKSFWKHNWSNGIWAILPFLYSPIIPVSWRHLVPLIFVAGLFGSAVLGFLSRVFFWIFLFILASYMLVNIAVSFQIALQKRDMRYLIVMPFVFGILHFGYGLGSLLGVLKIFGSAQFWKNRLRLKEGIKK